MSDLMLTAYDYLVLKALCDGKPPWTYLRRRPMGKILDLTIRRLHAEGLVQYERHAEFTTPVVTDVGRAAIEAFEEAKAKLTT